MAEELVEQPKTIKGKVSTLANIAVRIYVALSLFILGVYLYERYVVKFSDVINYTPVVFVENSYIDTDAVELYSFVGATYNNTSFTTQAGLLCLDEDNYWVREVFVEPITYNLKVNEALNKNIQKTNAKFDFGFLDSLEAVIAVRELGERLSAESDKKEVFEENLEEQTISSRSEFESGAGTRFAVSFDISKVNHDVAKTCRLKTYYFTSTRFFDLTKSTSFFTHPVTIK